MEFVHDASRRVRENQKVLNKQEASAFIREELVVYVQAEIRC